MQIVKQRILITGFSLILLLALTVFGVKFLQGYRIDVNKRKLKLTGLLVIKSSPSAAQIFLNNRLSGATDMSLSLSKGLYSVRLTKPGYQSWSKKVRVEDGLVTQVEATLWPISPDLSKITYAGVLKPVMSPNRNEIAYVLPSSKAVNDWQLQPGIYILNLANRGLLSHKKSRLIAADSNNVNFDNLEKMIWSPDGSKLMVIFKNAVYLLSTTNVQDNTPLLDISYQKERLLKLWRKQREIQLKAVLEKIKSPLSQIFADNVRVIDVAPNDNLLFYQATASAQLVHLIKPPLPDNGHLTEVRDLKKGFYYVYNIKNDKNYYILGGNKSEDVPKFWWMADSEHLLAVSSGRVMILDLDGSNWTTVFTGEFKPEEVFPAPSGQDVIVLMSLNPTQTSFYNLYNLSLR